MLPTGVDRLGTSTPGCNGGLAVGVLAMPRVGATRFAMTSTNGPGSSQGLLLVSGASLAQPILVGGAEVWVAPASLLAILPVVSDSVGYCEVALPIPADPLLTGLTVYSQFLWPKACAPNTASSTAALQIVVQSP